MSGRRPLTVLVVHQDPLALVQVRNVAAAEEFRVLGTGEPYLVPPLMEWENVDIVVAEQQLADLHGVDLLARLRGLFPDVPRILLDGRPGVDCASIAINVAEVLRYLPWPCPDEVLDRALHQAAQRREFLRHAAPSERARARWGRALEDMEPRHPGIGVAALESGVHVIPGSRLPDLVASLGGTGLETVLG